MKINRQPLAGLSEDVLRQNHQFWSKQVASMLGNGLAQDPSVDDILISRASICTKGHDQIPGQYPLREG